MDRFGLDTRMMEQNGHRRVQQHFVRRTAQDESGQATPAVRRHGDEPGFALPRGIEHSRRRERGHRRLELWMLEEVAARL